MKKFLLVTLLLMPLTCIAGRFEWDASLTPDVTYSVYLNGELLESGITETFYDVGELYGSFMVVAVKGSAQSVPAIVERPAILENARIIFILK